MLDGGAGFDTATYWFSTSAVYISLLLGSGFAGDALDDTFISIEKVIGSSHDDVIAAGNGGNVLDGWIGDDRIYGGDGRDDLYGGLGIDRLYGGANVDNLDGGSETDYLFGEDGEDTLDGGDGDDVLRGGRDSDTFIGSSGADACYGGDGERDLADYSELSRRVEVDLETGRGVGGLAEGDQYDSIEDVTGSRSGDRITGNSADNHLRGGDGVDVMSGGGGDDLLVGGAGADQLDGGSDSHGDTISYQDSISTGVRVDLSSRMGRFGDAEGDKFARIENVTGSRFKDTLVGDRGNNVLMGLDESDELYGNEGNDTLWGGRHGDHLWGGAGSDSNAWRNGERQIHLYQRVRQPILRRARTVGDERLYLRRLPSFGKRRDRSLGDRRRYDRNGRRRSAVHLRPRARFHRPRSAPDRIRRHGGL